MKSPKEFYLKFLQYTPDWYDNVGDDSIIKRKDQESFLLGEGLGTHASGTGGSHRNLDLNYQMRFTMYLSRKMATNRKCGYGFDLRNTLN